MIILHRSESLAALPVTSEVNKDLGLEAKTKVKDHHQGQGLTSEGQGLKVSRPRLRSWILALRSKAKANITEF